MSDAEPYPRAIKIALNGESRIPVGAALEDGTMLAIGRRLQAYMPDGQSMMSSFATVERRIEHVSPQWLGGYSSDIVALFLDEEAAWRCFWEEGLKPFDPRWVESTRQTLQAIGEDHPAFYVHAPREQELAAT